MFYNPILPKLRRWLAWPALRQPSARRARDVVIAEFARLPSHLRADVALSSTERHRTDKDNIN